MIIKEEIKEILTDLSIDIIERFVEALTENDTTTVATNIKKFKDAYISALKERMNATSVDRES